MLTIASLLDDYRAGRREPREVIASVFARIAVEGQLPNWISLADQSAAVARAAAVDRSLPLAGIPFAVKDNIDVAGMPTTAGCPSFAYVPSRTATVVARLLDAGAILIGKTNMDQFATGLVGTRSPYGACSSAFDARYISGGSSSGSAVVVAQDFCAFSLGTDTAGSGRVPAAFNSLVGFKPTRGVLSTAGVVPACRSLDCVSIFARDAADAEAVWRVARAADRLDEFSRPYAPASSPWASGAFRFGMPVESDLNFFGDADSAALFEQAAGRLERMGGTRVAIDFGPFREAASLLYSGPWVAERFAAVGEFLLPAPAGADPTVAAIVRSGAKFSAVETFRALYRLEALKREAEAQWQAMDVLLLPTAGTTYTKAQVQADPIALNANLGYYTNFVNLMDLAAVAVPAGFTPGGLPFGVSFVGRAFSDAALTMLAGRFERGAASVGVCPPGCVLLAVVGAHLTGQPLNRQLTERGARLVKACRTSPPYRLFVLRDSVPAKPGLLRDERIVGDGIALEVWAVPETLFGGFVAEVPPPLAIGSVELDSGEWVKGFVCEPAALSGAEEITRSGGWIAYRASLEPVVTTR